MIYLPAVAPPESPVLLAARRLHMLLELADIRGLPMPFAFRGYDYADLLTLQFRDHLSVHKWATEMGAFVTSDTSDHPTGTHDRSTATGTLLEVPVEVVASVRRLAS
jgi:hypothetical protein